MTLNASADPATRKPLVDPNLLDAKGLTAIDWFVPFDDGSKVAASLSKNGSEDGTLHVYDVATAKEIDTPIPRVQYPTAGGSLAWAADGKGFWYTRYPNADAPAADQHFNMQVYFHRLGSDPKSDTLALGTKDGLLMGAEITQHPGLARAVVSAVGIYDMVRVELDPNGSFNTTEYGTVKNPDQFKALYAYSPYHHVASGTAYPAVLMLTGATDGRVNPMHSRKFTAALQAATSSGRPVLLRTNKTSGHGIGSSLDERIAEQTDELTFLFDQLGVHHQGS